MRFSGQVKSWNAERGFGFIQPTEGGQEIFLHISAVPTQLRPPKIGQEFTFNVELNREGKKRAANVGVPQPNKVRRGHRSESVASWSLLGAAAIPAFVAIYAYLALTVGVKPWFAAAYVAMSIICLLAYAADKSAAVAGQWRSSEQSLLVLGLLGGWPGGLLAQQLLRHKTNKTSFRVAFWVTVVLNVAGFVVFHTKA